MNVGDIVTIVSLGKIYSTYPDIVNRYCPSYSHLYADPGFNKSDPRGQFKILAIVPHEFHDATCVIILSECGSYVYVIGDNGIAVCDNPGVGKIRDVGGF